MAAVVSRITLTAVGRSLRGTSRHRVGRPGRGQTGQPLPPDVTERRIDLAHLGRLSLLGHGPAQSGDSIGSSHAQGGSNLVRKVSWDAPSSMRLLSCWLKMTPYRHRCALQTGLIEVLLEDEKLTRLVALMVDGELIVTGLLPDLHGEIGVSV